ncbi:MFS transporter [Actinotignum urinale]|uniref:MFS transporter n=1 Tax=Actinotignum urinale TaxID=190146 RepID=UPI00370D432D
MKLVDDLKSLLRSRGFFKLLGVRLVTQCGDGMFQAGLASLFFFNPAAGANVTDVAISFLVLLLPFSLVGPFTGPFIDRWPRRQILFYGNLIRGFLVACIVAATLSGIGWLTYVIALTALGVNRMLLASLSASLPNVVESNQRLLTANSLVPTLGGASTLCGAAIGFLLRLMLPTQALQQTGALIATGILYVCGSGVATLLGKQELGPKEVPGGTLFTALRTAVKELADGVRYLIRRGTPAAALGTMSLHRFIYQLHVMMVILAGRNLYADPANADAGIAFFGGLFGAMVAGHGISIILTPLAHEKMRPHTWIVCCLIGGAVGQIIIASTPAYSWVVAGMFIFGIGIQGAKIAVDTIVQSDTADTYRGRAFSLYDVLFNISECIAAVVAIFIFPPVGWSRGIEIGMIVFVVLTAVWYATTIKKFKGIPRKV